MKPLRILYLEAGSGSGGSSASLERLISRLTPQGIEPHLLVDHRGSFISQLEAAGVPVEVFPIRARRGASSLWQNLAAVHVPLFREVCRQIRRHRPDVLHINNSLRVAPAAVAAAAWCRLPVVCHLRVARPLDPLELWLMRWIDAFVVLSETSRAICLSQGAPASKVICIPDGLDVEAFRNGYHRPSTRARWGLSDQHVVIGVVCRLQAGKGLEVFLQAMPKIVARQPNVRAVIVGDVCGGPTNYRRDLEQLIGRLHLSASVTLAGWVNDPASAYAAFDLLVQTSSLPEGFSLVCLEAMAFGLPVVSTRVGATGEVVDDGVTGRLVPPGDPKTMADTISEVLADRARMRQMGQAGYQRAVERFDIRRTAEAIEAVYRELAQRGRR